MSPGAHGATSIVAASPGSSDQIVARALERLRVDADWLGEFCRRWRIARLALFGSVLRDDFRRDSDVDVLVEFEADAPWSLLEVAHAQNEMEDVFSRPVDLVESRALRNPFRRQAIIDSARTIHGY